MADVEIVIRNLVEGLEDVEKVNTTFGKLSESTQKWGSEYERANKSLADFMNRFDAARKVTDDMDKIMAHAEGTIDIFAETTAEATKRMEEARKATAGWRGQLTGTAKGLLGIATVYAGGRWLAGLVKDSLASARAAGVAAEGFDDWDDAVDRLGVSFGTLALGKGGDETAGFFARIADGLAGVFEIATLTNEELDELGVERGRGTSYVIDIETGDILDANDLLERQAELLGRVSVRSEELTDKLAQLASQTPFTSAEDATKLRTIIPDISGQMAEELEESERLFANFISGLIEGFGGETVNLLEGLRFEAAGGDELLAIREQIKRALFPADGKPLITPEEAETLLGNLRVEELALEVELGLIGEAEAVKGIADALQVPISEAQILLNTFQGGIDLISLTTVDDYIGTKAMEAALAKADQFEKKLDAIHNTTVDVKVLVDFVSEFDEDFG